MLQVADRPPDLSRAEHGDPDFLIGAPEANIGVSEPDAGFVHLIHSSAGIVSNTLRGSVDLQFVLDVVPLAGVSDLCALAMDGWSYAATLDEYVAITAANCGTWTDASSFLR